MFFLVEESKSVSISAWTPPDILRLIARFSALTGLLGQDLPSVVVRHPLVNYEKISVKKKDCLCCLNFVFIVKGNTRLGLLTLYIYIFIYIRSFNYVENY